MSSEVKLKHGSDKGVCDKVQNKMRIVSNVM